jgi:2-dehydro-3-deoxyphosphogluconate aldolase/(4S)-4-hydroxy-2-oxoglutarate aldolase
MTVADRSIESRIRTVGLIPILRRMPEEQLLALAEAIIAGGAEAIEVTLDSPGAVDAICSLRQRYGGSALLGAGTVMTTEQIEEAIEAGAQFLLSPHLDVSLVHRAKEMGAIFMPGVLTPTEIVQAEGAGVTLMKLFPAGPLGPSYLKDLLGPFRGRAFFPTGGVTPDNVADFIRAGAAGVGMGSALTPADDVARQDWQAITGRVYSVMQRIADAREQP